ncbi:MAG: molybdopterin-binding/glycosyltransferase family 2 protein [Sedimenticola sp.]
MKYGPTPLDEALGAILAHTLRYSGGILKKGRELTDDDLAGLARAGITEVVAARPEPGDIDENTAASRVAAALTGPGIRPGATQNGRCSLHASALGLLEIDTGIIDITNQSRTAIVVATLATHEIVGPEQIVATIKVIPYTVPGVAVDTLCEHISTGGALRVHPYHPLRTGLVLTQVQGGKPTLLDKAETVIAARIESYGSRLSQTRRCQHRTDAVAGAISNLVADGVDLVLILGAASIGDTADVVPAAIEATGGTLEIFGIPVDPGNLLAAGRLGTVPVIGLPGCARSPRLNGTDLVLNRVMAGLDICASDLLGLGVGGLLHDVEERPERREATGKTTPTDAEALKVAAIILAGGSSRRAGPINKLLAPYHGKPLVRHVIEAASAAPLTARIAVTGHEAAVVREALTEEGFQIIHNPRHREGMSTSIKTGIQALPVDTDGAIIMLGDMPDITVDAISRLIAAFEESGGRSICVPTFAGRRGNPVLWPRAFFSEILDLEGDTGARDLIRIHTKHVIEVPVHDDGILRDVDKLSDITSPDQ